MIRPALIAVLTLTLPALVPAASAEQPVAASRAAVAAAQEALELHYIQRKIYRPVSCATERVDGDTFVLCGPVPNRQVGGLFVVLEVEGAPAVAALNGKAKGHVDGAAQLASADGKPVAIVTASPDMAGKIGAALAAF